jgi:hypothetical protein
MSSSLLLAIYPFVLLSAGDEDSTPVCGVPYEPVDALHPED